MIKIKSFIYILFLLAGFSCSSQKRAVYFIESIDDNSLNDYYILRVSYKDTIFNILSKKKYSEEGILLNEGTYVKLKLREINGFRDSNIFIRVGKGYFVDGIKVFDKEDKLYQSDCLKGLYFICD